jgi:hypothetical protein
MDVRMKIGVGYALVVMQIMISLLALGSFLRGCGVWWIGVIYWLVFAFVGWVVGTLGWVLLSRGMVSHSQGQNKKVVLSEVKKRRGERIAGQGVGFVGIRRSKRGMEN